MALPAAIPIGMAAASLAGKIWSGISGAKKEKKEKEERTKWATGTYGGVGDRFKGYGERAADVWQGTQDWGLGELGNLYGGIDEMIGYGAKPGYRGEFDESRDWWKRIADEGWRTPKQGEAGWGWGTFEDFAKTGGWSPQEMADYRARASAGVPEMYGGLRNELLRGRAVQGGYGPGYSEAGSQLARDRARAIAEASLGAETSLAESIRKGKMWGGEQGLGAARGELGQMMQGREKLDAIAEKIAAMNRSAGGGFSPMDALRMKLGLIDARTGLARQTGGEMQYVQPELAAYGGYAGTVWPQKQGGGGGNFWNSMLSSAGNALASYYGGGYGGGGGGIGGGVPSSAIPSVYSMTYGQKY